MEKINIKGGEVYEYVREKISWWGCGTNGFASQGDGRNLMGRMACFVSRNTRNVH